MTNLEAYILHRYGKFVPFDIASEELGFDVLYAVACCVERKGSLSMKKTYVLNGKDTLPRKDKPTSYSYHVPVMSALAVRGEALRYKEFARLLVLNMHLNTFDEGEDDE